MVSDAVVSGIGVLNGTAAALADAKASRFSAAMNSCACAESASDRPLVDWANLFWELIAVVLVIGIACSCPSPDQSNSRAKFVCV